MKIKLIIILTFILFSSCEENNKSKDLPPNAVVYKFKSDSSREKSLNKVCVQLTKDRESILGVPGYRDPCADPADEPPHVYKDYCLQGPNYGLYTAYLNITKEQFQKAVDTLTRQDMEELIIDRDPYAEYYVDEDGYLGTDCPECLEKDTVWPAIDTAKFHRLVDNNELEKYLKRLK